LRVFTTVETGLGVFLEDGEPVLLQPVHGGPGERLVSEVRERRPSPQGERVGQQPGP
jgi:hypothetical protein